jgi:hypothetical protein
VETGRRNEAAKIADDYLKRKDVWTGEAQVREFTMLMLRTLLHEGVLSKDEFTSRRDRWLDSERLGILDHFDYRLRERPKSARRRRTLLAHLPGPAPNDVPNNALPVRARSPHRSYGILQCGRRADVPWRGACG